MQKCSKMVLFGLFFFVTSLTANFKKSMHFKTARKINLVDLKTFFIVLKICPISRKSYIGPCTENNAFTNFFYTPPCCDTQRICEKLSSLLSIFGTFHFLLLQTDLIWWTKLLSQLKIVVFCV